MAWGAGGGDDDVYKGGACRGHMQSNQHSNVDQNPLKNFIYVEKQGYTIIPIARSSDYLDFWRSLQLD